MAAALEITHLHKSYPRVTAVKDLSLLIEEGEIFALLGPNGAGKSTTINMIAGVTHLGGGSIKIFGHDNQRDFVKTRQLTGVMHQEIVIDNFFTMDQALKIHAGYYGYADDPAWRALLIDRLALGPHLQKKPIRLSGGMKRRFMVAKALIHKPKLLILDEPTAGVDVELRRALWEFVREINRHGTTVLLTTHYLEEAEQMCERIAIMNHGEIVAMDKTRTLVSQLDDRKVSLRLQRPLTELSTEFRSMRGELSEGGSALSFVISDQLSVTDVLRAVTAAQLPVSEISTQKASLEDVFIRLTSSPATLATTKGASHGATHLKI